MKMAVFIHSLGGGGAERVASNMAGYWSAKGEDVSVITVASAEGNRYQLSPGVDLIPLSVHGESSGIISGLLGNITRVRALRACIKKLDADVVISMMPHANVINGLACLGLRTKSIGSERNYPGIDYTSNLWIKLRRFCYRYLDAVVVQTEVGAQWIRRHTNAKFVVSIPNSVDVPLPDLPPVVSVPDGQKMVIGVGRLTAQKQFHHLITAFSEICGNNPEWNLMIIGEGELKAELQQLIDGLELSNRVKLVGRVGNISDWYNAADIFAMTSQTEGFPNALVEAMAHGVPVLSYDCLTGPAEILDGENGLLIELDNIGELRNKLEALILCPEKRADMGARALEIKNTLTTDKIMMSWSKLVKNVLT